jgi:hypothetical protein
LVPITMKSAAKCDKQCELQNSANHQILEKDLKLLKGKRLFPMFFNDEAWTSFSKDGHPFFIKLV